ncbi:alpha/beta hydrolase family protein [Neoroseomonas soli]|uniref:Alpha/beta hydrolase n=1 Tax=Neoroseomonas soli TaxID=1081025 RepID=A0A9X9WZQ8_9PROT|nr:alpha/beta hydrolase [Neoroseomonas soli]MBR0672637.1 alpha/beta hydrolase [Neoroseomonas soli]
MHKPHGAGFLGRAAVLLALLAAPARAQDPNVDFTAYRALFSVASLGRARGPSTVIAFTLHYRGTMPHAGFALHATADGRSTWRFVSGLAGEEAARAGLQTTCDKDAARTFGAGTTCRILALDGSLLGTAGPAFRPVEAAIGPFRAAPLMFRHGPGAAQGVVVWSHGYGGPAVDHRRRNAPGVTAMLNDAGWDILRFDRDPADDLLPVALASLTRALPLLREAGYRRIVLAGQSRGGWQSVMAAAERPDLVHAALAFAPAAHGEAERPNNHSAALEDFSRLLAGLPADGPRLGVALFEGDAYDPDPAARGALVAEAAGRRRAPTVALLPEGEPRGHAGAFDWRFTRSFAPCLVTLVQAPAGAPARGLRRAPCGGG